VTLFEGHNQQIRKMFDSIGHSVVKLRRLKIGPIDDRGLRVGEYRKLTPQEVSSIKAGPVKKKTAKPGRS
jgi:23S rRNA pseudouridine2605 synthase